MTCLERTSKGMEVEIRSPNSGVSVTRSGLFCAAVTAGPETNVLDLRVWDKARGSVWVVSDLQASRVRCRVMVTPYFSPRCPVLLLAMHLGASAH